MTFEREASVKDFPWISFTSFRFKQNGAGSTESSHIRLMHVRSASDHLTLCFMPCRSPGVILKILEIPWGRRCGLHSPSWLSLSLALFLGPAGSESKLGPFHGFHQDQKALSNLSPVWHAVGRGDICGARDTATVSAPESVGNDVICLECVCGSVFGSVL
uniref:Uncharacterized protein n=1 Tax=Rousettus aegyptiacus TaxID=9407 RepID=A0A7J8DI10_ROUAE|nr:hypothetical protein HJG63_008526 [Rousettus aegyptiacus]